MEKKSGSEQVEAFLENLTHPHKEEIEEVRRIILSTDQKITEHIKWNAPSFCYHNEDRITFNLNGKGYFRLIFHLGAKVKDSKENEPLIVDSTGLLEWVSSNRAIVKFTCKSDVKEKKAKLREVITKWLEATNS
ncbi:DUF1801 domain-containing protein [Sutcliffiella rhizosphaerae]|uniref:YdhG-like domain-containing protein n=1 Tax=Sutcliffiella rhizosphaerae TaxID=2880967 RepID=A0ABN8AG11_9BACI|nr:DUF1801 domain-containing protein [Sutcliffiella rhizosphaerae]CAG9623031.1 hypothetical protein BACCIP111883_03826 [Sutcliffiella rhizosphaerae]